MTLRHRAAFISAAVCLSLAVPQFSAPAFANDDAPLKVSGKDALKGATTVAIGAFTVGFIFQSTDQTKSTGGLIGAFGGTTKAKSELVGVTPEMMGAVADAAYADYVAQLTAAGFTVQDPAAVFASDQLARTDGAASPIDINIQLEKGSKGKATYVKPAALPRLMLLPGDFVGSGFSSMGLAMSAGQTSMALSNYARAAGIPVIDVVYLIDFSDQKRPGAFSFGGLEVNANLSVVPGFSRMSVLGPNGKTITVTMKQGVSVDGDFIQREDASSGLDKTTQAAANVGGGLLAAAGMGGLAFGKTRKFEFTARPGAYEEGAVKAASLASERLVQLMTGLR